VKMEKNKHSFINERVHENTCKYIKYFI